MNTNCSSRGLGSLLAGIAFNVFRVCTCSNYRIYGYIHCKAQSVATAQTDVD